MYEPVKQMETRRKLPSVRLMKWTVVRFKYFYLSRVSSKGQKTLGQLEKIFCRRYSVNG